jgi:hypothetical protein
MVRFHKIINLVKARNFQESKLKLEATWKAGEEYLMTDLLRKIRQNIIKRLEIS